MNLGGATELEHKLNGLKEYQQEFQELYPNMTSTESAILSMMSFINGLVTPAPIDSFIAGDVTALTDEQVEGGHVFNDYSCYSCHTGSNLGGQMIQKLGITEDWPNQKDLGYYYVNYQSDYKMFFRVASLRNVTETAPYFHDGSENTLWNAIKLMGKHERGLEIPIEDALKIQTFLKVLSGDLPEEYIIN